MSKWSGCVLILAGVAVGTYALYPQPHAVIGSLLGLGPVQVAGGAEPDPAGPAPGFATKSTGSQPATPKPPQLAALQTAAQTGAMPVPADPARSDLPPARVVPPAHLVPPAPVPAQRSRS